MTDVLASNAVRLPATPEAVDAVHGQLERLWEVADFVPALDRMAFETAVVEAASNAVRHAVAASGAVLEIGVEATVTRRRLEARICEYGAVVPDLDAAALAGGDPGRDPAHGAGAPDAGEHVPESGRGLALIRALVTTLRFERRDGNNIWTLSRDSPASG
ncbi:MAG: ATP-binding protein [Arthrobacter sp.]|uniref:ATP-binding protein n=1 Tax=Arthrobacter sp. TaxID=1667 RepID=UPI003487C11C